MRSFSRGLGVVAGVGVLALAGCQTMPTGPTVQVMPAPGKPFDVFAGEDQVCRAYATQSISGGKSSTSNSQVAGTVAATALGAVAGALLGDNGASAAAGAGVGLIAGSALGAGQGSSDSYTLQRQYNIGYMQCMYAKGNIVPGMRVPSYRQRDYPPPPRQQSSSPYSPQANLPPPPPPPPGYGGEGY